VRRLATAMASRGEIQPPIARGPERGLLGGRQAYRCNACDEEISIQQPDPAA